MEIDVNRENLCINKLVAEKKELVFVEEDMIVPDTKPDILNTINLSGNVCVYKKEVLDGRIKIEGSVNTYIMYVPDSKEDSIRGLNASIDFNQTIDVPEAKEGMNLWEDIGIKDLECKVINGRKINVKIGLDIKVKLQSNEDVEIINSINNVDGVQIMQKNMSLNSLVGSGNTRVYVKDTLNIDEKDEIAEVLKTEIKLVDNDIKISYNKVLSKCEVKVNIMYLTEDNRIQKIEGKIPAVGFIDIANVSEDNTCEINNQIGNILIRPNPTEEHSIYVEIELETACSCFTKKEIRLIQDIYSPIAKLEFSKRNVNVVEDKVITNKEFTITSKTNISELAEGNLIDVELTPRINKEQVTNSKTIYEGEIIANFIYNKGSNTGSKISKIPFEFSIDNPMQSENIEVQTKATIENKSCNILGTNDVECNIDILFSSQYSKNTGINIIDDITLEESNTERDYDSLIIYIVQKGDTLWKIAKKFNSTIDDIVKINGIENPDKINIGEKLYIPKFKYIRKREPVNEAACI